MMRHSLVAIAMTLCTHFTLAQDARPADLALTPEQINRMAESYERTLVEGQAWARVKDRLDVLYRQLRQKGETREEAMHNLRRIGLPGVDVAEFGQKGQEIRQELDRVAQYVRRKDGLSESASVAAAFLTLHNVLQTLVAIERPSQIHIAIEGEDGNAKKRRSENLYEGNTPRFIVKFTERVDADAGQECMVDTLRLTEEVYFTVTCRAHGKDTYPMAAARSQCSINDDRMRAARLVLQASESASSREVFVWCSSDPR
jgi:hypothetical protein